MKIDLGTHLRAARKDAELSQKQVSERAECDRSHLSDLEWNKQAPKLDLFFRLCKALGLLPSNLVQKIEVAADPAWRTPRTAALKGDSMIKMKSEGQKNMGRKSPRL